MKFKGNIKKIKKFIIGDNISKIPSDEKPLYEFSKIILKNQFTVEIYPNQNGASIKIIVNKIERIINVEKNESFRLKFGLIGAKLEIDNFISNVDNISFEFSIKAILGASFVSKKINVFKKQIIIKKSNKEHKIN